jgi:hypothetical protein
MKKITLLILLFSSIASFSQEQVMLDIERLLNLTGNGKIRVLTSSNSTLYESYGAVNNYGLIINLTASNFPLSLIFTSGLNGGCSTTQTYSYTYADYLAGRYFIGGCAPEYFYIRSPHVNKATGPVGVCENISLSVGNVHYYSTTGAANSWSVFPSPQNAQSVLGSGFRGSLYIKSDIDSYYANPKVTLTSKINIYTITGCSPKLDGKPAPNDTKCKFESSGSVTLKFLTEIDNSEKFLFTIYKNGVFDKSIFALKSEIVNKSYTWTGFAEGSYYIKYQSQSVSDNNTTLGNSAITTDSFDIKSPEPLTFTITELQPKCHGDQGAVLVTAKGGTSPYFYMIDGEILSQKHPLTTDPIFLTEGDHKITVVDDNSCIEK